MEIKLAETAGFCMGVKRAMDSALKQAESGGNQGPCYTYGPLIHNRQAVDMLEKRGIHCVDSIDGLSGGTIIIRAHGVPPETLQSMKDAGLNVVDATCPRVRHSQNIIRKAHEAGRKVLIAGDKDHAEVVGLLGYCENRGILVTSIEELKELRVDGPICFIAQTTFNEATFMQMSEIIKTARDDVEVVNTICKSTESRQREVSELCKSVDAMVVVGGTHSANTCRLAEIARKSGIFTVHVETANELPEEIAQYEKVGITAGASTPSWVTSSVIARLEDMADTATPAARFARRGLRFLTNSNLYTAFAAAALTYAGFAMKDGDTQEFNPLYLVIAFSYIFCVHVWNRVSQIQSDDLNAPPRVVFYARRPRLLLAALSLFSVGSLFVAASFGTVAMLLLLGAWLMALVYNIPLAKRRRLRDIPASKEIFTATGWATVAVIIPSLSPPIRPATTIVASIIAFALVLLRTTMFDFTDIQGDRLLGRETLPVVIGPNRTRRYMAILAAALMVLIGLTTALGMLSPVGYLLILSPLLILLAVYPLFQHVMKSQLLCPLLADGALLLAGVLALLWRIIL